MAPDRHDSRLIIRYNFTLEDMLAANELHAKHSPSARRMHQRLRVIASVVSALLFLIFAEIAHRDAPAAIAWWFPLVFAIVGGLFMYGVTPLVTMASRSILRQITCAMFSSPNMRTHFGEFSLEADEEGFTHRSTHAETRYAWGALERVETIQDQTVLYVGAFTVINIPHKRIVEGDFASFLMAVNAHCKPGQVLERSEKLYADENMCPCTGNGITHLSRAHCQPRRQGGL